MDRRKTLNLHKELETPVNNTPKRKKQTLKRAPAKSASAIGFKDSGSTIGFNGVAKEGGACKLGGALAFNEAQLMNELTGLKKGGALGTLAATIIPVLI